METVKFNTPTAAEIHKVELLAHQLRSKALRTWFGKITSVFATKPKVKTYAYDKALQI